MKIRLTLVLLASVGAGSGVSAQEDGFPNPLRTENLAATCSTMSAQIRAADPQAMAVLVGTWIGQTMIPGIAGLYPDTPAQVRVVNQADGTFTIDYSACFQPYGMARSCAQSFRYGEWTAHFDPSGWIAVPSYSAGSAFTGQTLPISCGLGYWRALDQNTLEDQGGLRLVRSGS